MSDAAVSNPNLGPVAYIGGPGFYDNPLKPVETFTKEEVQSFIDDAVAKAVTEAVKKLTAEGGMPKFVMSDVIELIRMFLEKMGQFQPLQPLQPTFPGNAVFYGEVPPKAASGNSDSKLVAGPAPVAPAPAQQQIVIVPTQQRLNDQGQVVNVIDDKTAAQYGVKPGEVHIGDTLTSTSASSSSSVAAPVAAATPEPVVSKAAATSYANSMSQQITRDIYNNTMAAQGMAEGDGANGGGTKKVAGKATAKSWLMAIAEALGGALGLKAEQMLQSTNKIAALTDVGKDLQAQYTTALGSKDETLEKKIQGDQAQNAHDFTLETSRLQGSTQEFNMLQNAMSNTIKTLGESLSQLARKG